jgi:hypothetical protein
MLPPHVGQRDDSAIPHSVQNFALVTFSSPHSRHSIAAHSFGRSRKRIAASAPLEHAVHSGKERFTLKRITDSKRLQAKLRSVETELMRRLHQPIPEQGAGSPASCAGTPTTTASLTDKAPRCNSSPGWRRDL